MNALAKPAQFDRPNQHRNAKLAKIHIAVKQLGITDDDYRQILLDHAAGKASARECSEAELVSVLDRLRQLGFEDLPKHGGKRPAQHPVARKARAMWISLHHLGVVRDPSDRALEAFACKQLRCATFAWANQGQGYRLIEALKDMATRNGWMLTDKAGRALHYTTLPMTLCLAIVAKLKAAGEIPDDWELDTAAFRLCGERPPENGWGIEHYHRLAKKLGEKLRMATGGVR